MGSYKTERTIAAPVEMVFDAIAHVGKFKEVAPHIVKVEILSDIEKGVGSKFRETRVMKGRESSTVLECTEYEENKRVRFVSDEGGTIWDTVFTTEPRDNGTYMTMQMDARPHKFMARRVTPMIMGMVGKAIEGDMDAVKDYCEGAS